MTTRMAAFVFCDLVGSTALQARLGDDGDTLARLVPDLPGLFPDVPASGPLDPETERYWLFQAVSSLLATVSRQASAHRPGGGR